MPRPAAESWQPAYPSDRGDKGAIRSDVSVGHARGIECKAGVSVAIEKDKTGGSLSEA